MSEQQTADQKRAEEKYNDLKERGLIIFEAEQMETLYIYMTGENPRDKFLYEKEWLTPEEIIQKITNRRERYDG